MEDDYLTPESLASWKKDCINKLKDFEEGKEASEAAATENVKKLTLSRAEISKLKATVSTLRREKKDLQDKMKELAAGGSAEAQALVAGLDDEDTGEGDNK